MPSSPPAFRYSMAENPLMADWLEHVPVPWNFMVVRWGSFGMGL